MTTILLLSLATVLFFTMWISALYRLRYWQDRALYAEALEQARNRDQQWHANLFQLTQPRKPTETD